MSDATASAAEASVPPFDARRDGPALVGMGALFLASIALAMGFSFTFLEQNLRAFEDPESLANPLIYLAIVVVFTVVILAIVKYGKRVLIKYIVLASVLMTVYYVVAPLVHSVYDPPNFELGISFDVVDVAGAIVALALTGLLWFYPEWYVIDSVGVMVAAGAAGIFGISFGLLPCILLLVAFAVYDAIAVYRTKHMLDLADSVLELRLPIMFVVPKTRGYSFLEETRRVGKGAADDEKHAPREAMFMGLGDAVIPGVLVVSALTFLDPGFGVAGMSAPLAVALATLAGSFAGFCALMYFVMKGRPHAGLPLLNGGALAGFFAALLPIYGFAPVWPF